MVHQHFTSVPALTVAENVALAAGWPVTPAAAPRAGASRWRSGSGFRSIRTTRAGRLSVALKQRLEIVKALAADARILLLDEPTAVLAPGEAEELLRVVRAFTARGGAAVLITHKLDEALARGGPGDGAAAGRGRARRARSRDRRAASLAAAMIGEGEPARVPARPAADARARPAQPPRPGPRSRSSRSRAIPATASRSAARRSSIRPGEIVGIAAVEGNGQRELLRAVAGRLQPLRGRREVAGPVGFIPEDRTTEGLIPELSLTENVVLGSRPDDPWIRRGRVDWRVARARTAALLRGVRRRGARGPTLRRPR